MASIDLDSDVGDESSSIDQNPAKRKNFYGDAAKYWEVASTSFLHVHICTAVRIISLGCEVAGTPD